MADAADIMADKADIMADTADIMADTADILARYRREADTSSAEAGRHSAAAHREHIANGAAANGAAANGAAANGAAATGAAATGAAVTGAAVTDSSSAVDLVIRTTGIGTPLGVGAFLTRLTTATILMGIILRTGTIMITIATPLTVTATPIDLRLRSCNAGSLERVTTMAPLMESWGRKLVVRFASMNGRTGH